MEHGSTALRALIIGILAGILSIVLYALQSLNLAQILSVTSVGCMVAGASLLGGGLLGFLFGIPRALQRERPAESASSEREERSSTADETQGLPYQANTNLEDISDWLTKIFVGVGLTQLGRIPAALQQFAGYISPGLGDSGSGNTFAIALLVYFLVCGFLIGYLWTRLYLPGAFRRADLSALGVLTQQVVRVESRLSEFEKQSRIDAEALNRVRRQLNPEPDIPGPSQDELNAAIKSASRTVRAQIFYLAADVRRENWREWRTKAKMERTIPIFRALIASDTEDEYHANHGQLGFALKDQREPHWLEAEAELSRAIQIRGSGEDYGWLFYEFNRALCRIHLDDAFNREEPSSQETRERILEDLQAAAHATDLRELIPNDPDIDKWMALNGIAVGDLA